MMGSLDIAVMRRIAERSYLRHVDAAYGADGQRLISDLIAALIQLYAYYDPEAMIGTLYVVNAVPALGASTPGAIGISGAFRQVAHVGQLGIKCRKVCVVEVLPNGAFSVCDDAAIDEARASAARLVYKYTSRAEWMVIAGTTVPIENPAAIHASVFARPTFSSLRDALESYCVKVVRSSSCPLFDEVWFDKRRLFLKSRPERHMRVSLTRYLTCVIPEAEVRPEQVVDESHPVDIKVTWTFTTRLALVEIKWLGKSRRKNKVTTTYTSSRARDGAQQLANYLEGDRTAAPHRVARGYLVVVDARRRRLKSSTTTLSRADAMHFAAREIEFSPEYHKTRDDFEVPIRMFAEPRP